MKKALAIGLSMAMVVTMLSGCGGGKKETEAPATEAAATEAAAETEAKETEAAATEAPATEAEATEAEATEAAATEAGTEAEATEAEATEAAATEARLAAKDTVKTASDDGVYKAALVIAGTLGDKSFYDSANEGLERLEEELGDSFEFKVEQMGGEASDEPNWEPILEDYCASGEWDLIITSSWQMADALATCAEMYPDQKFIFSDETYDFETNGNYENIYNVMYKQNEVSYLAGAIAGLMTKTEGIEGIDPSNNIISVLGGQDGQVINDFIVGYIEGAQAVNPDIQVATSYVGDYIDSAKGKDLGLAMFNAGSDIGYCVAGAAGNGQIEAAKDTGHFAIGVDSDQAATLPDYADWILTSAMKNVGTAVYQAVLRDMDGELPYGTLETLGFSEGGVGLVKDAHYEEMVPEEIRNTVEDLEQQITNGEITVSSAYEMTNDEVHALIDSVAVEF